MVDWFCCCCHDTRFVANCSSNENGIETNWLKKSALHFALPQIKLLYKQHTIFRLPWPFSTNIQLSAHDFQCPVSFATMLFSLNAIL